MNLKLPESDFHLRGGVPVDFSNSKFRGQRDHHSCLSDQTFISIGLLVQLLNTNYMQILQNLNTISSTNVMLQCGNGAHFQMARSTTTSISSAQPNVSPAGPVSGFAWQRHIFCMTARAWCLLEKLGPLTRAHLDIQSTR